MARADVHPKLGRIDADGKFRLADVPKEEIDEARAKARKAIAAHEGRHFGSLRPAEASAVAAAYAEPWVRAKLALLEGTIPPDDDRIAAFRAELARLLVDQGRFGEAAEVHEHGEHHAAAAHRPDGGEGAWCECPEQFVERDDPARPLRSLLFEAVEIPSEVHGGIVRRYRCKLCGHTNISPEPPPQDAWYYNRLAFHGTNNVDESQLLR